MNIILPFYSPTEVVLVDDNYEILIELQTSLSKGNVICKIFDNPFAAQEYINTTSHNQAYSQISQPRKNLIDGHITSFHESIYNPNRFQQISAVITDFNMPGMNGLELCQGINSPHIQKIVLTGVASEKTAVEAFNSKKIDYFIQKNDITVIDKLKSLIAQSQEKYFRSITDELLKVISYENQHTINIANPAFINVFQKLLKENQVSEYYLLDSYGSTLFLTAEGKASALFVYDRFLLGNQEELIPGRDIDEEVLHEIYNNKKVICYYQFNNQQAYNSSNWKELLQPLRPLEGTKDCFWAYAPSLPYFKKEGILSFNEYKKSLSNE